MERLVNALNGKSLLIKLIYQVTVIGIIFWMFCQVRDFPSVYVSKAESHILKQEMKVDMDRIYHKLDSIEMYLRKQK